MNERVMTSVAAQPLTDRRWVRTALPIAIFALALLGWEAIVRIQQIPHYILPSPSLIVSTLWDNLGSLSVSWWFTVKVTFGALALAVLGGVVMAMLFALSRWVELSLFPFAVILQVTPIIAIAPLIIIFVPSTTAALLLVALIVAFFPVRNRNNPAAPDGGEERPHRFRPVGDGEGAPVVARGGPRGDPEGRDFRR